MAKIRAINNYHGGDGYKNAGQEWDVSNEEAKALVESGAVELVKEEKAATSTKEEKAPASTKDAK